MTANKSLTRNSPWKAPGEATSPKGLTALSHNLTVVGHSNESPFDAIRQTSDSGSEFWSARDLADAMAYDQWRNFDSAVARARISLRAQGYDPKNHIAGASKMVTLGSGSRRAVDDHQLTRFGAYLVVMNGDPRKPEVAAAQAYFAVKTREAETATPAIPQSYAEALRAHADAVEARERAEERVAELEPAAAVAVNLLDALGDWSVSQAAKILSRDPQTEIGQRRLFDQMADLGWIFRAGTFNRKTWEVKQAALKAGLVAELARSHPHPETGVEVIDAPQVRVTAKGVQRLHTHLGGAMPLRLDVQS